MQLIREHSATVVSSLNYCGLTPTSKKKKGTGVCKLIFTLREKKKRCRQAIAEPHPIVLVSKKIAIIIISSPSSSKQCFVIYFFFSHKSELADCPNFNILHGTTHFYTMNQVNFPSEQSYPEDSGNIGYLAVCIDGDDCLVFADKLWGIGNLNGCFLKIPKSDTP